ncbi:MAG: hypothetical protein EPN23_03070 [Verrucomicrobia bacterium]|nr:MAG: hypothetical protein EPN23_03070 [Verrucomicrobiota bacterium]
MNINWSSLTKEQKQIALLIGIGVVVLLAILYQFALQPMVDSAAQHKRELAGLRVNLDKAAKTLEQEARTRADTFALKNRLETVTNSLIPPFGNSFSWATEQIYQTAKEVGVDIDSVSGGGQASVAGAEGRTFLPFTTQMAMQCSYADLIRFLRALETKNPLVVITTLSVEGREQNGERHPVSLSIEWPSWAQPPAASAAPKPVGSEKKKT